MSEETSYINFRDRKLAYRQILGNGAKYSSSVMFLGGYGSDMTGTKASFLAERCQKTGRGFLRFDYSGHGQSSGKFTDGCIGDWFQDALAVFDNLTEGKQLLVGSSMGGWIGLLLAKKRPEKVAGFIGVAAAPDFTEDLIMPNLSTEKLAELKRNGMVYEEENPTEESLPITLRLIEDARDNLVLRQPLELDFPVHLLQGQLDEDVPWRTALNLAEHIVSPYVRVTLIKDGDHRLSRPQDLDLLWREVEEIG